MSTERTAEADFHAGLELLTPFLEERDFELIVHPPLADDEQTFYSAQYVWSSRAITLIHLHGLASVTYSIGQWCLEHVPYLEALGVREDSAFPPAIDDPLAGYRALLNDFETRLAPFFDEPDREFIELAQMHGQRGRPYIPGL